MPHALTFVTKPRRPRAVKRGVRALWGAGLWVSILPGCADAPPALEIGPVRFAAEDLSGLREGPVHTLSGISALALAVRAQAQPDGDPASTPLVEANARRAILDRLREEVLLEAAGITETELETRYRIAPDVELEVRHLVVLSERWRPEAHRRDAAARVQGALDRISGGEAFEAVAGALSEEPGAAERGGRLRPGRVGTWVPEFWGAALVLAPGGISGVVETEYGFHVLKLERKTVLPFADGRARVVAEVARTLGGGEAWEAARLEWTRELIPPPTEVFEDWLRFQPAARIAEIRGDAVAWDKATVEAAAEARLLSEAARRGLTLDDATRQEFEQAAARELAAWAGLLGLREGLRVDEIAPAALWALRATGQNAQIGRDRVNANLPALLHGLDIRGDDRAPPPLPSTRP